MSEAQPLSEHPEENGVDGAYLLGLVLTTLSGFLFGLSLGLLL